MSQVLSFNSQDIRTIADEGEIWFAAKDVCAVLDIKWNGMTTLSVIPEGWRRVWRFHTLSKGLQSLIFISEAGLYMLAFRSNKENAVALTRWVASDVLPSIRRAGKYEVKPAPKAMPSPEPEHSPPLPEISAFPMYDFDKAMQVTRRISNEIINEGMAFSDRMRAAAATITDCFVDKKRRSNVANAVDVLLMAQERSIERLSDAIWSAVHSFYEQGEALYYFARLMKHAEKESEARRRKA